jgi:hypothetical protein
VHALAAVHDPPHASTAEGNAKARLVSGADGIPDSIRAL